MSTATATPNIKDGLNRMFEVRDSQRAQRGAHFAEDVRPWVTSIRSVMTREKCNALVAFDTCCNRLEALGHLSDDRLVMLVAAMAEVSEQTTRESENRTMGKAIIDLRRTNEELFNAIVELDCQRVQLPKEIKLWMTDQLQEQRRLIAEIDERERSTF